MSETRLREITEHLRAAARRAPGYPVVGFHLPDARIEPCELLIDEQRWQVKMAESDLEIRCALVDRPDDAHLAIFTPLDVRDLSADVRARLPETTLWAFDPWDTLLQIFDASRLDPALADTAYRPLGRALLELADQTLPKVSFGLLDRDTAWETYLTRGLKFPKRPASTADLLSWALRTPANLHTLDAAPPELRHLLREHLRPRQGPATDLFFAALAAKTLRDASAEQRAAHALALGLAADLARSPSPEGQPDLVLLKALEKHVTPATDAPITPDALLNLGAQATLAARQLEADEPARLDLARRRLDELITHELPERADTLLARSLFSPRGFKARQRDLIAKLNRALDGEPVDIIDDLERLDLHGLASQHRAALDTLRDTARLIHAITHIILPSADAKAGELARDFIETWSFVDTLRESLTARDPGPDIAPTLDHAIHCALELASQVNRLFATDLRRQLRGGLRADHTLGVQNVIDDVVAPLCTDHNVLLIVLDGMSWAVLRALLNANTPELSAWDVWAPAYQGQLTPVVATLPSITEFSRTSLLTGSLRTGTQHTEKQLFGKRPALMRALGSRSARLFHKAELDARGRGNVGDEVTRAIDDPSVGLVGVVVNAVDDQLGASSQVHTPWTLDAITPLRSLLARASERRVILTADHGHVWETRSQHLANVGEGHDRWRSSDPPPGDDELAFEGPLIEAYSDHTSLVFPITERLRYTGSKRGYHGGATLQELICPLIVLSPEDAPLDDTQFARLSTATPPWWRFEAPGKPATLSAPKNAPAAPTTLPAPEAPAAPQLDLLAPEPTQPAPPQPRVDHHPTLVALRQSPLFQQQLARNEAMIPAEDVDDYLRAILRHGQRVSLSTLAHELGLPPNRLSRRLTALAGLLNLEGYSVLSLDYANASLSIDLHLLESQFQL